MSKRLTDTERVRLWLLEHPGSTTLEMTYGLQLRAVTQRMSDLRAKYGRDYIVKWKDAKGRDRFRINDDYLTIFEGAA
jgi:hypothetical protein